MPYTGVAPKQPLQPEKGRTGAGAQIAPTRLSPRSVAWIGSSKDDISALPGPVKVSFGHRLRQVQDGETPLDMKPLTQFGTGVFELRERFDKDAYRLVYVAKLEKAIYVLHAFMKKSKSGIGLPRQDVELIETRLKRAHTLDAED
jgi:phage-related protein